MSARILTSGNASPSQPLLHQNLHFASGKSKGAGIHGIVQGSDLTASRSHICIFKVGLTQGIATSQTSCLQDLRRVVFAMSLNGPILVAATTPMQKANNILRSNAEKSVCFTMFTRKTKVQRSNQVIKPWARKCEWGTKALVRIRWVPIHVH